MKGLHHTQRLIVAVAMLAALAACGKKAALDPPDNATVNYTYPLQYPNPTSVLPSDTETPNETTQKLPPPTAGDLSPFPTNRTKTTYQSGPSQ